MALPAGLKEVMIVDFFATIPRPSPHLHQQPSSYPFPQSPLGAYYPQLHIFPYTEQLLQRADIMSASPKSIDNSKSINLFPDELCKTAQDDDELIW